MLRIAFWSGAAKSKMRAAFSVARADNAATCHRQASAFKKHMPRPTKPALPAGLVLGARKDQHYMKG